MTSPVSIQDDSAVSPTSSEKGFSERVVRAGIGLTKLARSPSSGSLNSVLALVNDSTGAEQHFKVCTHCMNLLDAREKQKEKQFHKPIVCQFYEKMKLYMEETMQILAMYNKMSESLRYLILFLILRSYPIIIYNIYIYIIILSINAIILISV